MDVAMRHIDTPNKHFTLIDAPGHRDFIPNMITGAEQADVAVLVVDASPGEFESGFDARGQTKEHAVLVRTLGVQHLIVAVNKMDVVDWSRERFEDIRTRVSTFLKQSNFNVESNVHFVPCSGFAGINVTEPPPSDCSLACWWGQSESNSDAVSGTGCIVQIMDALPSLSRNYAGPLRMCCSDVFRTSSGLQ